MAAAGGGGGFRANQNPLPCPYGVRGAASEFSLFLFGCRVQLQSAAHPHPPPAAARTAAGASGGDGGSCGGMGGVLLPATGRGGGTTPAAAAAVAAATAVVRPPPAANTTHPLVGRHGQSCHRRGRLPCALPAAGRPSGVRESYNGGGAMTMHRPLSGGGGGVGRRRLVSATACVAATGQPAMRETRGESCMAAHRGVCVVRWGPSHGDRGSGSRGRGEHFV